MFDFICHFFFEFLALMVMTLSLAFRFAIAFWGYLLFLAIYYISLHVALYRANVVSISSIKHELTYNDLSRNMEYRAHVQMRVRHRSNAWSMLMAVTLVMLVMSFPAQFLYAIEADPNFSNFSGAIRESIWLSFVLGNTYTEHTSANFFAYCWGYYFILLLLVLERKAETWAYNRYEVGEDFKLTKVRTTRQHYLLKKKKEEINDKMHTLYALNTKLNNSMLSPPSTKKLELTTTKLNPALIGETEAKKSEEPLSERKLEKLRFKKVLTEKYMVGMGRGIKTLAEHTIFYLLVVACIVKANLFSLAYFSCVFIINTFISNATKQMVILTFIVGIGFLCQYGLMLTNINPEISPKTMPDSKWCPFTIPWYPLISGDERFTNDWAYFFQLGNHYVQIEGLWFEIVLLLLLGLYF